jgi:hypothetical protein
MRRSTWPQPLHAGPPTPAPLPGPSPLRAAVLSKRCDLGHRTKLSIESRGGATGGARLNRRSAPFGCSADNRQTTQTIPVAALASDTSPGLGNVPECRFHGLVMPGTGSVRMASRALRRSAAAILRWPCSRRIAMAMLRRLARRSELVIGFDNPHDRREPCMVYIWSTSARPTHPTSPTGQARTTPRPCRGSVRTELHSRSGGSTVVRAGWFPGVSRCMVGWRWGPPGPSQGENNNDGFGDGLVQQLDEQW